MTGLNKITDRILADARTEADRIIEEAEADAARIKAEYQSRAKEITDVLTAETERMAMDTATRARSSADTQKRNFVLQCKSDLVDSVFDETLKGMQTLEGEKYISLLAGLLTASLLEQIEAEKTSRTLYGEEDALDPEAYEVILNMRDRDRYGRSVVEAACGKLYGKIPPEKLARLKLASTTAPIDGGLILRCGSVESNCSFALLFAELRRELEAEVGQALFAPKKQN
ncbi:MAG: V-type ATP synthase subunit E [Clostridia bacterium]|nr:V-type ATP synthase subunit E [Clostridia bacterium]